MPTYDYKCGEHGYFEKQQQMKDHASAKCPQCAIPAPQVMTRAPGLDIEAMADVGMPGAFHTSGDRITKRHKDAGQEWTAPEHW